MPPRAGKSYITSLYSAWVIGKNPSGSVMRNCCTSTLYDKFSYDTRDIVKSERFQKVFPDVKLRQDKTSVSGWNVEQARQVSYFGNGVGGTIIGFGATSVSITDDLYKSLEDALSDTVNDKIHRWKESAHDSRLEKDCPSIDIGTRWREDDVIGRNDERGNYDEIIKVKALGEDGETFCDDVKTTKQYLAIKDEIDELIWNAEYQQTPIEAKGLCFPKSELNWFELDKFKSENVETTFFYVDVADEGDDYLSAVFADMIGNKYYVTNVIFTQDPSELTMPLTASKIDELRPSKGIFESNNGGKLFATRVKELMTSRCNVKWKPNTTNKETRILMNSGRIKNDFYFASDSQSKEYNKFIEQLTRYKKMGKNKHDDAPDSMAGLAEMVNKKNGWMV